MAERAGRPESPIAETGPRTRAPLHRERSVHAEVQLRAARAEAREREATLALARDTALNQKLEIARLRSELEASPEHAAAEMAALEDAFRSVLPEEESIDLEAVRIEAQEELRIEIAGEQAAAQQEIERLKERVVLGERETEARETERRILRETLAAREAELQSAYLEIREHTLRRKEENALIQTLNQALDEEREHNAETQSLLARLRETLQQNPADGAVEMKAIRDETRASAPARRAVLEVEAEKGVDLNSIADQERTSGARSASAPHPVSTLASVSATPAFDPERLAGTRLGELAESENPMQEPLTGGTARLFDTWQDDQVRRHFGPFGIDTTRDLVMAPLLRRNPSLEYPAKILVLGNDQAAWTERLAEDLISSESPPFQILLSDDAHSPRRAAQHDRPITEFISTTRTPASPADFEALLAETRPSVIVSRNFLSHAEEVGPWLDVLRQLPRMGPGIVLLESTGVGPISPTDAMIELGDRIWSLMPDRYTRSGTQNETRTESWQQAFREMPPVSENRLRAALREDFDLEISAQFGFLTEPFLRSSIARNFDADAQRDRRFLHQIADLDDRKIEAGSAPALHFVARIDGRTED